MKLISRKPAKLIALFLAFSLIPLPVYANVIEPSKSVRETTSTTTGTNLMAGKLLTWGNEPVLVNGNVANTGATILTGATLQTFGNVRATVQLGRLGSFDLAPNTTASIDFSGNDVKGMLKRGCVILNAGKDINGLVFTPSGAVFTTEKLGSSRVDVCVDVNGITAPGTGYPAPASVFDLSSPPIIILIAAATFFVGVGTFALVRGRCCGGYCWDPSNPSPSRPRDCGCCC